MNLFSEEMQAPLITENHLTPRQWKLYTFLKLQTEPFRKQEEMLNKYEIWIWRHYNHYSVYSYGYRAEKNAGKHYSDMSSARAMRKDLEKLRDDPTIQKIICSNKIAETVEEATEYLDRKLIKALKILKSYHIEKAKLEKHFQTRMVFNNERDLIIAVKELEEEKGNEYRI